MLEGEGPCRKLAVRARRCRRPRRQQGAPVEPSAAALRTSVVAAGEVARGGASVVLAAPRGG
eukprot:1343156-Lingulodinium_polyedra.AAC.1